MVATFNRDGITFKYPENWRLSDDSRSAGGCCVTLQSPGSGFWMLQVFAAGQSPEKLAAEVLRSMRQDYDGVEARLVRESVADRETVGYDMQFYCLDFLVSSQVRSFADRENTYVTLCQAEDREFDEMAPVFLAITTSLIDAMKSE